MTLKISGEVGRGCTWKLTRSLFPGVFTKPSISAHPGSLVRAGGTVTLHCHSELVYDTFILLKEGDTKHSQQFVEELPDRHTQAHFSMGPMTSAHTGTYKCYGSVSHSPNEWSVPSDPLDMAITSEYAWHSPCSLCALKS